MSIKKMEGIFQAFSTLGEDFNKVSTELLNSGYVTYPKKVEKPIFTKTKLNLALPEEITHLKVSNNCLICLMSHQVLLRLQLPRGDNQCEVFLEKYLGAYNVTNLFFDPSGNHLLIPLSPKATNLQPELLYLHTKKDTPKKIDKYKDHEITAVGFNHNDTSERSTGPILLGTSKGLILATEFGLDDERVYYNNWKQVYEIRRDPREVPKAITGIEFYKGPDTNAYIVLVSTVDKIYKFQETLKSDEKLVLQNIFHRYMNTPEELLVKFSSTDHNRISTMSFNCDFASKYPKEFSWLTDEQIFYAKIDPSANIPEFITNEDIICFPENDYKTFSNSLTAHSNKTVPKAIILTDFHVLLMYPDHITAMCTLDQSVVYEEYFSEKFGVLLNIFRDFSTRTIYAYTSKSIFRINITNEQRNIWKIYLDRNEFSLAEKFAKENIYHLDIVLCQKAEKLFLENKYIESAEIFSKQKQLTFEKVCLKFLDLDDKKPLMIYLKNKLNTLDKNDQIQITLLTIWIIELHLDRISKNTNLSSEEQNLLDIFMANERVQECCRQNYSVIYNIMASHGDKYNLTNLTIANKDYESVVNQYINEGNLVKALETIKAEKNPELYYKYCPILMEFDPQKTISAIIEQKLRLKPKELIPTLICTKSEEHILQIIRYLEFAIYEIGVPDKPIHNYFIKLLAQKQPDKLLSYLETEGREISSVPYDCNYALRVCEEHNAKRASVFLQRLLQLWESAVELALTFDIELAQKTASQPQDDDLKRKLWLRIAEHEVKRNVDVKEALKLLKECDLLKIEDLLPFFDDFTKIDDFKVAICNALKDGNLKIQEIQHDMDEAGKAADRVCEDLQSLRSRSVIITAQDLCSICEISILMRPFFIFPCGHKFHADCLKTQIMPYLSIEEQQKLISNTDIENILTADCLFCGVMIDAIDKPFIRDDDWDRVDIDWQ